jgi:hypothetical protein
VVCPAWRRRNEGAARFAPVFAVSDTPVDWPSYIDAMAALHELPLSPERRGEVIRQMMHIETLARRFVDFPLEAEVEPAPVFRP